MKRSTGHIFILLILCFFTLGMTPQPPAPPPAVTSWWLSLDLGKTSKLSKLTILWSSTSGSTDYSIQGSNDSNTWTSLLANQTSAGSTTKEHALSGSYRYVRIYINKAQSSYPIIYEVRVYGGESEPPPPAITSLDTTPITAVVRTLRFTSWTLPATCCGRTPMISAGRNG